MVIIPFPDGQATRNTTLDLLYTILTNLGGSMVNIVSRFQSTEKDILYAIAELLTDGVPGSGGGEITLIDARTSTGLPAQNLSHPAIIGATNSKIWVLIGGMKASTSNTQERYITVDTTAGTITYPATGNGEYIEVYKLP